MSHEFHLCNYQDPEVGSEDAADKKDAALDAEEDEEDHKDAEDKGDLGFDPQVRWLSRSCVMYIEPVCKKHYTFYVGIHLKQFCRLIGCVLRPVDSEVI